MNALRSSHLETETARRWRLSGAQSLTGPQTTALHAPDELVERIISLGTTFDEATRKHGLTTSTDALSLITERASANGTTRQGTHSVGGATKIVPTADHWIALSMPRESDVASIPAWAALLDSSDCQTQEKLEAVLATQPTHAVLEAGRRLGLAVAALGEIEAPEQLTTRHVIPKDSRPPLQSAHAVVIDLSSLWAGPLCTRLLSEAGAHVIKVESSQRLDGTRRAPHNFFQQMNQGKDSVVLDFSTARDLAELRHLLLSADVVVEGSRPRALEQLGLDAAEIIRDGNVRAWVSLTGYGRSTDLRERVAFGDDAAVAGGLVAWFQEQPYFVADAIADPLSGLVAATAVLESLATSDAALLEIALSRVAAWIAGRNPRSGVWEASRSSDVVATA